MSEETKQQYAGRLDEIPGLFGQMKPMAGAIEASTQAARAFRPVYPLYGSVEQSFSMV